MSGTTQETWMTGWTAGDPVQIGYTDVPADGGTWEKGFRPELEYRDLGLAAVTDAKLGVQHIRVANTSEPVRADWHCHDVDFQWIFILRGQITFEMEDGETVTLRRHDTAYIPPLYWHTQELSPDFEAVEITAPGKLETILGRDSDVPARAARLDPARKPVFTYERPESYTLGDGPRKFFEYRDLGTRGATNDRIHVHIVRATGQPGEGTGWHYHTMAQWFMVIRGTADIRVETGSRRTLQSGDTMCIGSGPNMRHNVAPYSGDYVVLEMCVPAEYETIPVEPPEGSAS